MIILNLKFPIKSIIFSGNSEVSKKDKNDKIMTEVADLQAQLKASKLEKEQLEEETKKLRKELENFNNSFFEEIEDLKYNYNEELKKILF